MNSTQGAPDMGMMLAGYLPIYTKVQETMAASRTMLAVMCGVVIFDYAVTFKHEIRHVWRAQKSWLNACLLANRYGIIAELTVILYLFYFPKGSMEDCKRIYLYESYMPSVVLVFANVLLLARVYALNKKNKWILGAMLTLLAAEIGVHIWNPLKSTPRQLPTGIAHIGLPDIRGCIPGGSGTEYYYLNFLLQVIFDAVAFIFAMIPLYKDRTKVFQTGGIWQTLARDSIGYFAICLAANLANIVSKLVITSFIAKVADRSSPPWPGNKVCYQTTKDSFCLQLVFICLIYFALAGEFDNETALASVGTGIQSIAASRMVFNLRAASSQTSSISKVSRLTGSGSHSTPISGNTSKNTTLVSSRFAGSRRDLDLENPTSPSTIRFPPCSDPLDASEKGYEMDDLKMASKLDSSRDRL